MTVIGELAVNAVVLTEGLDRGAEHFKRGVGEMAGHARGAGESIRGLGGHAMTAGGLVAALGTTALAAAGEIYHLVHAQGEIAEVIQHSSKRIGVSVEQLSQYRFAAQTTAGVMGDELDPAIERMNTNIGLAAHGQGRAAKSIEELGLSAAYLSKLKTDERVDALANAIQRVSNAADKTRLTEKIFGDGRLMEMLDKGAAGLHKLADESDRVGATFSGQSVEDLENAAKSIKEMHTQIAGAKREVAAFFAPAVAAVAHDLGQTFAVTHVKEWNEQAWEIENNNKKLREHKAIVAQVAEEWRKAASAQSMRDIAAGNRLSANFTADFEKVGGSQIENSVEQARQGNKTFGMSDAEAARLKLHEMETGNGAWTSGQKRAIELQRDLVKELEMREKLTQAREDGNAAQQRDQQLQDRAHSIIEQNLTPLEKLKQQLTEISDLNAKGLLDPEQAARAAKNAQQGFDSSVGGQSVARHPALAAIKFGSAEAYRAIHESRAALETKKISEKSLKELEKGNELTKELISKVNGDIFGVANWS